MMLSEFYQSKEWEKFRDYMIAERLSREGEIKCERCGKTLVKRYDVVLHHKDELTDENCTDPEVALNPANIMMVCHWCHDAIHERWGHQRSRHVYLVYGCPCAGKRDHVDKSRGKTDLVVDIDAIYQCLGGDRDALKGDMFAVYNLLQDRIRTRAGKWRNAWVITTKSTEGEIRRFKAALGGCEAVEISRPIQDCYAEAARRGGRWPEWVDEWARRNPPRVGP